MDTMSNNNNIESSVILVGYNDLLSVKDLAQIFDVSKQTIYKEIKDEKFGIPIKIGRSYKIPKVRVLKLYFHT
ncbi:MAG: helix-turn-helix domain-containing protein [Defluviitaleaceae bacterium]|nr:helix-turn-helix domain-containing protein [Defluviitaleaceae bacterium]